MFCELFGYSKQAYYKKHKQVRKTDHPQADAIKAMVMGIGQQMPRLGTRKLYFLLKEPFRKQAIKIGRDGLFTLLRTYNLLVDKKKKSSQTTHSKHWFRKYPNQIKQKSLLRPEQIWVADITYINMLNGFSYLHLITDAYSKQIMGYELSTNMEAIYTLNALKMALTKRQYTDSALIHHSDRGIQYCSKVYTQVLTENNITISMTENGDPYENAIAERVNGILKDELGLGECFEDIAACKLQTRQSIDIYNHQRPHLSCHMLAPVQMHQQQELKVKTWQKKTSTKPRLSGSA